MQQIASTVQVLVGDKHLYRVPAGEAARLLRDGIAETVDSKKKVRKIRMKRTVSPSLAERAARADCRHRNKYTNGGSAGRAIELKAIPKVDRWVFVLSLTDCLTGAQPEFALLP